MNEVFLIGFLVMLPIAVYSGYRIGKKQSATTPESSGKLSSNYIKGLNYLLNEQPDKAVDTFIDLLQLDSETVDTHMALGHLFRKRGEVDRSIRLHQNIIARPQLSKENHDVALYELAVDYQAVGMYDRATSLFTKLLAEPKHKKASLHQLLVIYQATRDWEQAAKTAEQLETVMGENQRKPIAHFYCELAEELKRKKDIKASLASLKKALSANPESVRATLLQGDIYLEEKKYRAAIKSYLRILDHDIAFLPEALESIKEAFHARNDKSGYEKFLKSSLEKGAGVSVLIELSKIVQEQKGDRAAAEAIGAFLKDKPSLKGLHQLIGLHVEHAQESAKSSLVLLDGIVGELIKRKPRYACYNCGFQGRIIHWQCPSCKEWSSTKPIQGLEGE